MASFERRIAALSSGQRRALAERLAGMAPPARASARLIAFLVADDGDGLREEDVREFARARLADYMVPAAFVELEALPRTPAGKVDRAALRSAGGRALAPQVGPASGSLAPRDEAEATLARIWAEVLGLDEVGVHDDFFEVGGDSLLSIRILARANQAGLEISPEGFFANPTVAGQARLAGAAAPADEAAGPVTGEAPLTPIQHWFFERIPIDPQHWNQSLLLSVPAALGFEETRRVLDCLLAHHETLRASFALAEHGWRQRFADPASFADGRWLERIDDAGPEALERTAQRLHEDFDLARGPLLRAAWRAGAQRNELLLLAHHLALDALSWRILEEDLETLVAQALEPAPLQLRRPRTSFKAWAEQLSEHAGSGELLGELEFWSATAPAGAGLPEDHTAREQENLVLGAQTLRTTLAAPATRELLQVLPGRLRAQVNELLLAALVHALARRSGEPAVRLDLEGHGREALFEGLDVSRTVGWFTTVFPVRLEAAPGDDPLATLVRVKEHLRAIPGRGLGYGVLRELSPHGAVLRAAPDSQLLFNYLGHWQRDHDPAALVQVLGEDIGAARSPRGRRAYRLEINARVSYEALSLDWTYATGLYARASVEALAAEFEATLAAMAAAVPGAAVVSPSDFPLADLDQGELDGLAQMLDEIDGRQPRST